MSCRRSTTRLLLPSLTSPSFSIPSVLSISLYMFTCHAIFIVLFLCLVFEKYSMTLDRHIELTYTSTMYHQGNSQSWYHLLSLLSFHSLSLFSPRSSLPLSKSLLISHHRSCIYCGVFYNLEMSNCAQCDNTHIPNVTNIRSSLSPLFFSSLFYTLFFFFSFSFSLHYTFKFYFV